MDQAGSYSATLTYLKAVKAVGTTDPDKVMAELKKTKINDMFAKGGYIRADGVMSPRHVRDAGQDAAGIKYPWDYYKVREGDERRGGVRPDHGLCPLAPK